MKEGTPVLSVGYLKGEQCNRNNCTGIIEEREKDGCCSCHINPPCGYCTEPNAFCPACEWDEKEEYYEKQSTLSKSDELYYKKQIEDYQESRKLFYKKYNGEIPADKLEIRCESHTHFTMKVIGVFPKGTETYESLKTNVQGTFGGRFNTVINKDSYRFEYIAYTD